MNRFDNSFNDVDRLTGRAFSWGYPDGVWVIGILYLLPVIATAGLAAVGAFFSPEFSIRQHVFPFLATCALYIPPVLLLLARSKFAVVWTAFLTLLYLAAAIIGGRALEREGQLEGAVLLGMGIAVGLQAYISYYTYTLKKDELLK